MAKLASSKITAAFVATADGMKKGVGQALGYFNKIQKSSKKTNKSLAWLTTLSTIDFGARALGFASRQLSSIAAEFNKVRDSIDRTAKEARTIGTSFAQYEGLSLAFRRAGLDANILTTAMAKLARKIGDARRGNQFAINIFRELGTSVEEIADGNMGEAFIDILDRIGQLDQYARQSYLQQLFEEQGARFGTLVEGGADSIKDAIKAVDDYGLVLSSGFSKEVEGMKDAMDEVGLSVLGIKRQLVAQLSPYVKGIADEWNKWAKSVGSEKLGKYLADNILTATKATAIWLAQLVDTVDVTFQNIKDVATVAGQIAGGAGAIAAIPTRITAGTAGLFYDARAWTAELLGYSDEVVSNLKAQGAVFTEVGEDIKTWQRKQFGMEDFPGKVGKAVSGAMGPAEAFITKKINELEKERADINAGLKDEKETAETMKEAVDQFAMSVQKLAPAVDSRSQAGSDYFLQQMAAGSTGIIVTLEKQQLQVLKRIEKSTSSPMGSGAFISDYMIK